MLLVLYLSLIFWMLWLSTDPFFLLSGNYVSFLEKIVEWLLLLSTLLGISEFSSRGQLTQLSNAYLGEEGTKSSLSLWTQLISFGIWTWLADFVIPRRYPSHYPHTIYFSYCLEYNFTPNSSTFPALPFSIYFKFSLSLLLLLFFFFHQSAPPKPSPPNDIKITFSWCLYNVKWILYLFLRLCRFADKWFL